MKLRIVTLSILLASGFFALTLQAQEEVLRSARNAENERENFELVNNSNADVYYSVGVENDPTLRAANYQLRQLRPLGIRSGVVPTNQRVEIIATRQEPQNRTYTVRLFSFTPGKDIFVQTVNRGGIIYIEPQPRRYLGLFGTSATGRDLRNNVTQDDIRSRDIDYTPRADTSLIRLLTDPSTTPGDLQRSGATPEEVASAHKEIIEQLDRGGAPQEQIKRVNNLVNQYYQQLPEQRPTQPTQPRPAEPVQPTPTTPVQPTQPTAPSPEMQALISRIQNANTLAGKVGLRSDASPDDIVGRTIYIIDTLNRIPGSVQLISILEKALNDYLEAQSTQPAQPRPVVPVQPPVRTGQIAPISLPEQPQRPSVAEREVQYVVGSGGLTDKEVDNLLKIRVTSNELSQYLSNLNSERLQEAKNSYQDLQTRALNTNFVDQGLRSEIVDQINTFLQLINQEIQNRLQQQPAPTPTQPSPLVPQPQLTLGEIARARVGGELTFILGPQTRGAAPQQITEMYLNLRKQIVEAPERQITPVTKPTLLSNLDKAYKQYSQKVISTQTFNITPERTIYQILNLPENTAPQQVLETAINLVQQLIESNIPDADKNSYITIILNKLVRDTVQQPLNQNEIQRVNNANSIQGALDLPPNASPAAVRLNADILNNRINATQLPEDITKSLFNRFNKLYQNYANQQIQLRGNNPEIRLLLPPVLPPASEATKEQAEIEKRKTERAGRLVFVQQPITGLTNEQVARILNAETLGDMIELPQDAAPDAYLKAFNDLVARNAATNYINNGDRNDVLLQLLTAGKNLTDYLRRLPERRNLTREQQAKEFREDRLDILNLIQINRDTTAFLKKLQSELNQAYDKYIKTFPQEPQPGPSGQPGPSVQPGVRPEQPTAITIAGREIDPETVIKRIAGHLNNIRVLESQIQEVSRRPVSPSRNQEFEKLQRQLNTYQKTSTQDVLRTAFGIPGIYNITNPTDIENIKRIQEIVMLGALAQPDRESILEMLNELIQVLTKQQS